MIKIAVLLAPGFEEIEAITPIDILRRAEIEVIVVGLNSLQTVGSHGITINCDLLLSDLDLNINGIIIPGGMPGALNISESNNALSIINNCYKSNKLVAAICASPGVVLGKTDILNSKKFTCYPGFENRVTNGNYVNESVVLSDNIITSKGPGTAMDFSLKIVEYLKSKELSDSISKALLLPKIS